MIICVTAQGDSLESQIDPRFGRCAWFVIINTETMEIEAVENSQAQTMGGAGVRAGQLMSEKGVKVVLTGNAGPNAWQTLNAAGIEIITGVSGSVREAVDNYKKGTLRPPASGPTVESHFGLKGGD